MTLLNRESILQADDLPKELVDVPEWGGAVYVRSLTGAERDRFESGMIEQRGKNQKMNLSNIRAKLAALTVCDEEGKRIFSSADIDELSKKSAAALDRIFAVARRLSGLGEDDVKELAEGLKDDPLEDSPSDLL